MKGLKWRAYSPATAKIAELVGAQPVTVQAAEVSQALATGVIDSYMSSGATGYDSKTYEHIKNFYDTQAWLPKNAVIVNQKAFDALDKPTQAAVLKAAADAEARGWKVSEEKNGWYLEQLKAKGMSIVKPSRAAHRRPAQGRQLHARRMAAQGRRRRPQGDRRVSRDVMRRSLDALYDAAGVPGGVVFGRVRSRWCSSASPGALLDVPRAGHRRLRGLLHGRGGLPRARAHAEARRAHPRDARPRARRSARRGARSSSSSLGVATLLAALFAFYSIAPRVPVVAIQRHLDRQRRDAAVDSAARDGRGHVVLARSRSSTSSCSSGRAGRRRRPTEAMPHHE